MDARLVTSPEAAGCEAVRLRRGVWWWLAALAYVALCVALIPGLEDYFSPFTFHVRQGVP